MTSRAIGMTPNEKQKMFFRSRKKYIAYGGSRGGGKSWAVRTKCVLMAQRYPGIQILILRRTLPELRENHILPLMEMLTGIAKYNDKNHEFVFANKSRIRCGYCQAENDVYQYQGQQYDVICLEEATLFTESQWTFIKTCNRPSNAAAPIISPRMYFTCNPGGVGHAWVKRLFIDRDYREGENPDDYDFIPAKVYDNKYLLEADPTYVANLMALPPELRRAHLEGDWDALAGQYFQEFRRQKHTCKPFEIPQDWKRFRSMDWGYNDPCCVLWHAVGPENRVYTYRELYVTQTLARDVADRVRDLSHGEKISYTVASPDMWQTRGTHDIEGENIAEIFTGHGVPLMKADNSRVIGWQQMHEFMADAPDGDPRWVIFDTCENLIRTLPLLTHDEHKPEDVSDGCEDHAPEAARYGLMSRPAPSRAKKEREYIWWDDPFDLNKKRRVKHGRI